MGHRDGVDVQEYRIIPCPIRNRTPAIQTVVDGHNEAAESSVWVTVIQRELQMLRGRRWGDIKFQSSVIPTLQQIRYLRYLNSKMRASSIHGLTCPNNLFESSSRSVE